MAESVIELNQLNGTSGTALIPDQAPPKRSLSERIFDYDKYNPAWIVSSKLVSLQVLFTVRAVTAVYMLVVLIYLLATLLRNGIEVLKLYVFLYLVEFQLIRTALIRTRICPTWP